MSGLAFEEIASPRLRGGSFDGNTRSSREMSLIGSPGRDGRPSRDRSGRIRIKRPVLGWSVVTAPPIVVVVLGELHAHLVGHYSFTGTARFGWVIGYILL